MKRSIRWILPVLALAAVSPGAFAQGGGPGGAGFTLPPALKAKFDAWKKWRENHKNIQKLSVTLMAFRELEKDPATKITKDQAKKIVPVFKAWQNKPTMSDDQAKDVNKQLTSPLNDKQLKTLATAPNPFAGGGRPGGGGGAGGARPGGAGGAGQMPDASKFPDPHDYNPLNPETSPFKAMDPKRFSEMKGKYNEFITSLEQRAK